MNYGRKMLLMRPIRVMLSTVFLLTAFAGVAFAAGSFPLRVNDVSGLDGPWPLVGGLPFPEGALRDTAQVRVVGADGAEVAAQVDVAATWRDGSIRWAHAAFTASPRGEYRVEFGPGVSRSAPAAALALRETAGGGLSVDTGAAVYEFLPDRLLPESARLGGTAFLAGSGDGAYLVDNRGRLARVAGPAAAVTGEVVVRGPARAVLRREGWYVTADGERLARARAWFYFGAGSPYLRVTHSLVFTEDTNEVWVRDYGLEFSAPAAPGSVAFAFGEGDGATLVETRLAGGEAYLFQESFPHFFDQASRAVVGRATGAPVAPAGRSAGDASFVRDDRLAAGATAGDWGEAVYADHALAVVMPDLARRFPKEISFTPGGARLAFWSGRGGRELDFRAATLVNEYWQDRVRGAPGGPTQVAAHPSNAQGACRTHDLWLLPRAAGAPVATARAAARAASDPPLLQADPAWLCASGALGWDLHPKDEARFPEEEALIAEFWEAHIADRARHAFNGFIDFGRHALIRGPGSAFRVSALVDYGLRRHAWGLYARSGERRYYDYLRHFNRFGGDWVIAHWTAGRKFAGGFASHDDLNDFWSHPFYWGSRSQLAPIGGNTGHDIVNWLLEYRLTGDEYARELVRLHGEAMRTRWADAARDRERYDGIFMVLRVLADLYADTWDEDFGALGRELAVWLIDLDNPLGINNRIRFGSLYKIDRNLISLYYWWRETGDEAARQAVIRGLDYSYRFGHVGAAFGGQSYPAFLFAAGYRWTGNPDYLRVVDYVNRTGQGRRSEKPSNITATMHPTHGLPAALAVLAGADGPIDPWPVVTLFADPASTRLLFRKAGPGEVEFRCTIRMDEDLREPAARVLAWAGGAAGAEASGVRVEPERSFQPDVGLRADPRHWYARVTVPATLPAGFYQLEFPGAARVDVLNSGAAETAVFAPDGFRTRGDAVADYFRVPEGVLELRLFLGVPMEVRYPDGTVAVEASPDNLGFLEIPAAGRAGAWSVVTTQPGIVRLDNVEPLFSRAPAWLVTGAGVEPPPRFEPPGGDTAFVPGPRWSALHLPGNKTLKFPRGPETGASYANFPGGEGTVEFWFRPNWSSMTLAYARDRFNDHYFLRAGSHDFQYRRGAHGAFEFASLNLWAHGRDSDTGSSCRFVFEAGQWHHVAFAWRTEDGKPGTDGYFAVYVDGREIEADELLEVELGTRHYWPGRVGRSRVFERRAAADDIRIGPLDGTIAQLRVSGVVRYEGPFTPPETLPAPDRHTRAQFALDGDFTGVGGDGGALTLAP